jgi:hypothetical protein
MSAVAANTLLHPNIGQDIRVATPKDVKLPQDTTHKELTRIHGIVFIE